MNAARYYFDDGDSRKFWAYALDGKKQRLSHGRIGSPGRETTKSFASASAAEAEAIKRAAQKVKGGYIEIQPANLRITRPKGKRKATEAQLARFEKRINARLPGEYRNFLFNQNGGVPEPYFIRIPGHPNIDNVAVGYLLGLYAKSEPYQSLLYAVEHKMPHLPRGQLPIAGDSDLFSISLEKKRGCIYFWDHEAADAKDEDEDGIVHFRMSHGLLLAGSFDEFLTRISVFERAD
jgi:predicted DNA-binding WGR domain protein